MGIFNSLKTRGLKGTIQQGILKALGLKQQKEEEIDSLYYYLNSYCDITSLPPTKNENHAKRTTLYTGLIVGTFSVPIVTKGLSLGMMTWM